MGVLGPDLPGFRNLAGLRSVGCPGDRQSALTHGYASSFDVTDPVLLSVLPKPQHHPLVSDPLTGAQYVRTHPKRARPPWTPPSVQRAGDHRGPSSGTDGDRHNPKTEVPVAIERIPRREAAGAPRIRDSITTEVAPT